MRSPEHHNGGPAVVDLDARRRTQRPPRKARYTFAVGMATELLAGQREPEPVIVRLGQHLERQGLTPAQRLAVVIELPEDLNAELWAQLRTHIERERAA